MARPRKHNEGELCIDCGVSPKRFKGYTSKGNPRWDARCTSCSEARSRSPWLRYRKRECEFCGHKPFFLRSLEVHHRDGDKRNNDPTNLVTLCCNCHAELHGFIRETGGVWLKAEQLLRNLVNMR